MRRPLLWVYASFILGILLFHFLYDESDSMFERKDPKDVFISGFVDSMEEKQNTQAVSLKKVTIRYNEDTYEMVKKIILYCSKDYSFLIGNQLEAIGSLTEFQRPTNPGQFDEATYYQSKNYAYKMFADSVKVTNDSHSKFREWIRSIRNRIRQVYSEILEEKEAGIVSAMVLGDKSDLDAEVKELYGRNGIAHVLAISGLHVSLIGLMVFQMLLRCKCRLNTASAATILFLLAYGEMTGFSISTSRAVCMASLSLSSNILGRSYDPQTALSLGGCIILGLNPLLLFQSGFLLSYGAVGGILFVHPVLNSLLGEEDAFKKLYRNTCLTIIHTLPTWLPIMTIKNLSIKMEGFVVKLLTSILNGLFASISVSITTFPILCYFFYEIPVYSILLNMIVIPCMSLIVILSLLGGAVGCLSLFWGRFIIGGASFLLEFYEKLCVWTMKLPMSNIVVGEPEPYQAFVYYGVLLGILLLWNKLSEDGKRKPSLKDSPPLKSCKRFCIIVCLLLPGALFIPSGSSGMLEITMMDVGQGDGIFIKMPEGTTIFMDGGSSDTKEVGKYRIEPFLKSQGIDHIDYVLITHADDDHTSGIMEMIDRMNINGIRMDHLIMANTNLVDGDYNKVKNMAIEKNIEFVQMEYGMVLREKEAFLKCLHPESDYIASTRNDYSIVCRLSFKNFNMMLTGDVEDGGEALLMDKDEHPKQGYDVLKVAHHGSKNSTRARFLDICNPSISLLTCGWKNRYGHPHEELLKRLQDCGSTCLSTVDYGAITIRTNGKQIRMESFVNGKLGEWDCKAAVP